jgi:hypothetical protein
MMVSVSVGKVGKGMILGDEDVIQYQPRQFSALAINDTILLALGAEVINFKKIKI